MSTRLLSAAERGRERSSDGEESDKDLHLHCIWEWAKLDGGEGVTEGVVTTVKDRRCWLSTSKKLLIRKYTPRVWLKRRVATYILVELQY